jgi:hypothetical protein
MRPLAILLGSLGAVLLLSGCTLDPPNIVAITPGRDAHDVPANQEIRIAFDRPMDHRSVETRFELRPTLDGCGSAACSLIWRGNTIAFSHPQFNFRLGAVYEVLLHGGYRDATGRPNSLEHSWTFTVEGPPALTAIDPPDGATAVAPDKNIILTFNRPMDLGSLKTGVSISPEVPYLIRARPGGDGSQLEVVPAALLRSGAVYTVAVQGASDTHGNPLPGRVARSFSVGAASFNRRIACLISDLDLGAFGVALVDPHADPFLQRATPKVVYSIPAAERGGRAILAFDWAPDGVRLVLAVGPRDAAEGRLRIVDLTSGAALDLQATASAVAWSPDGTAIAYLSGQSLHLYRPASGGDLDLTPGQTVLPPLAFAPDGKSIAFAVRDSSGLPHLEIMNLELRSVYHPIGLSDPADHPAWSFDGTKLAFRRLTERGAQLWVYDLSGSSSALLQVASLDMQSAAWLGDNSTLVAATGSGVRSSLYRINVFAPSEAGGQVKLTGSPQAPNGFAPTAPAYDRRIAFTASVDGLPQVFVMNGDGSGAEQLTRYEPDFPYTAESANWSPLG